MINWDQIRQLEDDIGSEDFSEVVAMFLIEVDEAVDALRPNPDMADDDMASALHFLKGSALNLGFQSFADLCATGEAQAKSGNSAAVDLLAACSLYDQSKELFLSEAAQHTSFDPEAG